MTVVLKDRIKQYTSTAGSGDLSFTTTPNGYAPFSSVFNSGDLTYYCIENGSAWEVGIGRYLQNSLSREAVFSSSTGSKLNLAGRSIVFVTLPASGIVRFDDLNESNLSLSQLSNVLNTALNSGDVLTYNGSSWENKSFSSSYSNEQAQDAVGSIFADTSSISLSYDDNTPLIYAGVRNSGIVNSMISSGIDSAKIGFGIVDNIEFGYLDGVTSSIQSQLNSKAASGHLHTSADITDFSESVDDRVSSLLNAGTGIQLTYNDSGNSLSIDAYGILPTGGSAGQILSKIDALNYNTEWIDNYAKEIVQYVKNSTGSTLYKGQVVYINGADGTNPTISLSIASGEPTSSKTLGFLKQDLNQGEFGDVVTEGLLDGLNTNAALNDGDPIWLSPTTPGGVVYGLANKPYAPNHLVFLGYVIRKNINNGRIYVKVQNGFELYELHNVSATGAINGDILRYNSTNSLWESQAPPLYTDENAQDAVGGILANTTSISLSYDDNANSISAIAIESGIDHNLLKNRIINEHINHTGVLINAGTGLTGGGDISSSLTLNLANTAVSSGIYGSNNQVASFTVDAQGRLISASNIVITPANIGAIGSLNGLTGATQTLAVANTGTDFNIVSSGTAHEFRIPDASETARGVVTTGEQTIAGVKTFSGGVITNTVRFGGGSTEWRFVNSNELRFYISNSYRAMINGSYNVDQGFGTGFQWYSGSTFWGLVSDGDYTIAQRTSTNAQTYRLYNTYTDASNYERSALRFATYSTARYAILAAESAGTGIANINLVLSPKGTGAFMLQVPDGTVTGGNARGTNAVDLQILRTAATQVASGSVSFVAGSSSTASGSGGVAIGNGNSAAGSSGLALGTNSGATNDRCIAIGEFCTASGLLSTVVGRGTISGNLTFGFGRRINESRPGLWVYGQGIFSAENDCINLKALMRCTTTGSTPTPVLLTDGYSFTAITRLAIPSGKILLANVLVIGAKSDGSAIATYSRKFAIKNVANTVTMVGTVDVLGTDYEDNAATNISITADNTNKALQINVTGITGETWRWSAVVEGIEIGFGT